MTHHIMNQPSSITQDSLFALSLLILNENKAVGNSPMSE
jgi:hypothetical protein